MLSLILAAAGVSPPLDMKPLEFRPVQYFQENCARCHGAYGSLYSEHFYTELEEESLRLVVLDMAAGPGEAPLKEDQVEPEVALHRAMARRQQFVALIQLKNGRLALESLPAERVMVGVGRAMPSIELDPVKPVEGQSKHVLWDWELPSGMKIDDVYVQVEVDGKEPFRWPLSKGVYSGREPLMPRK